MLGRFANDDLRNKYGCTTPEECAFVQRWLELFHRKSLDTYAVKMRNTHSILREMLDTLAQVQNGVIHAFNLSTLKDEAIDLLNNDLTLDRFNRPLKKKLLHTISFGTKKEYFKLIELTLRYALAILDEHYQPWVIDELTRLFREATGSEDSINGVIFYTETLATSLINSGWDSQSLYKLVFSSPFEWSSFMQGWDSLCSHFSRQASFHCFIEIQPTYASAVRTLGLSVMNGREAVQDFGGLEGIGFPLANEFVHESATTYAYNLHAAVLTCLQRYEGVVSLLSHYGEDMALPQVVHVVLPSQRALTYSVRENSISSSQGEVAGVVESFVRLSNSSRNRLEKVFRQTRLAYKTKMPEIQFSNLWVALEALVTGGDMESGIESLSVVVPAILTAGYVARLVNNFLLDLRRCGVQPVYAGRRIRTENPDTLSIINMVQLFREPNEFRSFLSLIAGHTLLTSRASWFKDAFATDATIGRLLRKHNSRLMWHLQRLYRARNNLVHAAEATEIAPLIRHLNSYLRDIVNEILVKSSDEQEEIDELLTKMSDNYSALLEMLDESTGQSSAPWYWSWLLNGPLFDTV